jgi:phosphate acetyltransferase
MCLEDRVSVLETINPNPTAEQLAEIAISSRFYLALVLNQNRHAYSSGSSGKGDEVDKVRTATEIV